MIVLLVWDYLVRNFTTLLEQHITPSRIQQPMVNPFQEFEDDKRVLRGAAEEQAQNK